MKNVVQKIIQLRNPLFRFDDAVSSQVLIQFTWTQCLNLLRGLLVIFYGKNPKGIVMESGVHFFNPSKIHWGKYLKLGKNVHVSALGTEGVFFGNNVGIGAYSRIIVSTSLNDIGKYIRIGNHVGIGEFAYLGGAGGLDIGDDTIVGQYFSCHPENHLFSDRTLLIRKQGVVRKGISIGSNCWIGSKVTILDGVHIGNGCVIAAGAVVTRSFPDNSIIGGVPAKLIANRHE